MNRAALQVLAFCALLSQNVLAQPYTCPGGSWHIAIEQNAMSTNCGTQTNIPVAAASSCPAAIAVATNVFNSMADCIRPDCKSCIENANAGVTVTNASNLIVMIGTPTCVVDPYTVNNLPRTRYQVTIPYSCKYSPTTADVCPPKTVATTVNGVTFCCSTDTVASGNASATQVCCNRSACPAGSVETVVDGVAFCCTAASGTVIDPNTPTICCVKK